MFKYLETFKVVYETKHFSKAAELLFIAQPTVSAQIKQLDLDTLAMNCEEVGLDGSPTRTVSVETISFRRGRKNLCTDIDEGSRKLAELLKGGERNG